MKDSYLQEASTIQTQYQQGLQYKKQMGFLEKWSLYERFKAGDQWPRATDRTKNLPRPVFNIIKQVENHKVSSVMNENIKMVFSAMDADEGSTEYKAADIFTRYADTTWELIKQDQLNEEALESASNVGTGIWHYYYDDSIQGGNKLKYRGGIKGEVIDPVNFFPGNPQNKDVQEQPYNIITHRELVTEVRKQALNNGIPQEMVALIKADSDTEDQAYDMAKKEMNDSNKVTVITKYSKEFKVPSAKPSIYFTKVASGVVVKPKTQMPLTMYPIVVMQWERRKRSIFGVSDTEGLIPNQKAINLLMAMQLRSTELTGWPKLLVDRAAIQQRITNEAGEVVNVTKQAGESIGNSLQYMNPVQMPAHTMQLVDAFLSYTKEAAGANENALGEKTTAQLNATAIMLLQKASGVPLESIKRRFYQAMEDVGLVWADMWKGYFNMDRMIAVKNEDGEQETAIFNGAQYKDVDMHMKIDIGPSSSYSETLMMTSLDKLFDKGSISLEQYLTFAPQNVIPFKDRLLKSIQQQQNDPSAIISQLTPEEQQAFYSADPAKQQAILAQLTQQQPQQAPSQPNQPSPMDQSNSNQPPTPMM